MVPLVLLGLVAVWIIVSHAFCFDPSQLRLAAGMAGLCLRR